MVAEPEAPYHAFISHASQDLEAAAELVRHLEARGLRCWIAPRDVTLSQDYTTEISHGVRNSRCLVVLLSEKSRKSKAVRGEIEIALRKDLNIYPVRLEEVEPGERLELILLTTQWIDAFGGDRGAVWERLAAAIGSDPTVSAAPDRADPAGTATIASTPDAAIPVPVVRPAAVPRARRWARRAARVLVYGLIGTLLVEFGPLGRGSAIEHSSQDVFYKLVAPSYGQGALAGRAASAGDAGAERIRWNRNITVLLFDDAALESLGVSWPVSAATHAEILRDLYVTYRPRAIMVDILFLDRRPGEEQGRAELRRVLADITNGGTTKIYLAGDDGRRERSGVLAELAAAADVVAVSWPGATGDGSDLSYPLATGAGAAPEHGSPGPAFEIYRNLCDGADPAARTAMTCPDEADFDRYFQAPMHVYWGVNAPDLNWEQANLGVEFKCKAIDEGVLGRLWALVEHSVASASNQYPQTCPYPQLIKVRDFTDERFRGLGEVEAAYAEALGQERDGPAKIVFYGTRFKGNEDTTDTPTHDRVAGVYLHAMALDNLLSMGPDYITAAGRSAELMLVNGLIILVLAAVAVAIRDARLAALRYGETSGGIARAISRLDDMALGSALWFAAGAIAIAGLVGLFTYVCFVEFRFAPINWIGMLIVVYLIKIVDSRALDRATRRYAPSRLQ